MDEDERTSIKTVRMLDSDHRRISQFCKENKITQANLIKTLLDNYCKDNEIDAYESEVKMKELTQNIIILQKENEFLRELLEYKSGRVKQMYKQIFKLQEEIGQLKDENKELEIRIKILN